MLDPDLEADPFGDLPDDLPMAHQDLDPGLSAVDLGFDFSAFKERLAGGYVIEVKDTGVYAPFGPLLKRNPKQMDLLKLCLGKLKEPTPGRVIVLKGRKGGMSTALEILALEIAQQLPWWAGIVAHTQKSSEKLFSIARNAYEHLPADLRVEFRNMTQESLVFGRRSREAREAGDLGHAGGIRSKTAGGLYPFSGDTIRFLHLSEAAKYDVCGDIDAQMKFIMSAMQSVPKNACTLVVAESSPNGSQGWFYNTWQRAMSGDVDAAGVGWVPFFFGFLDDPSARMPVPEKYDWGNWPAEDKEREEMMRRQYGASPEHLMFRRFTIYNEFDNDPDLFDGEYPLSPEVAFRASGRPVFPRVSLAAQRQFLAPPRQSYHAYLADLQPVPQTASFE